MEKQKEKRWQQGLIQGGLASREVRDVKESPSSIVRKDLKV